jgi:hypothetical protein
MLVIMGEANGGGKRPETIYWFRALKSYLTNNDLETDLIKLNLQNGYDRLRRKGRFNGPASCHGQRQEVFKF